MIRNLVILCSRCGDILRSRVFIVVYPYSYFLNLATYLFVLSDSSGVTSYGSAPSSSFYTGTAVDYSSVLLKKSATTPSVITFEYLSKK